MKTRFKKRKPIEFKGSTIAWILAALWAAGTIARVVGFHEATYFSYVIDAVIITAFLAETAMRRSRAEKAAKEAAE